MHTMNDYRRQQVIGLGLLVFAVLVYLLLLNACGNQYVRAYQSLATVRATCATTEQTLSDACRSKADDCKRAHPDLAGYNECTKTCRLALESWITYVRPSVNAAIVGALGGIETARLAKAKVKWIELVAPVACALARGLQQFGHLLPPTVKRDAELVANLVSLAACGKAVP